jgi:PAS domain-containing protein
LAVGLFQWAAWPLVRPYAWALFYPALFASSCIAGPGWSIAAAVLSAAGVWRIFVHSETADWAVFSHNIIPMVMFLVTTAGFSLFQDRLRRARTRAETSLERLRGMEAFKAQFLANMLGQINQGKTRYQDLFEHMTSGFAHCSILVEDDGTVDFVYLAVNPAFTRLTGLGDVVGKRISALLPGAGAGNRALYQAYARVARSGVPECLDTFVDGLGVWFTINIYSPARGEFIALFDSLTEQRKIQQACWKPATGWNWPPGPPASASGNGICAPTGWSGMTACWRSMAGIGRPFPAPWTPGVPASIPRTPRRPGSPSRRRWRVRPTSSPDSGSSCPGGRSGSSPARGPSSGTAPASRSG